MTAQSSIYLHSCHERDLKIKIQKENILNFVIQTNIWITNNEGIQQLISKRWLTAQWILYVDHMMINL